MKARTGILIALTILAAGLITGCGAPIGGTVVAVMSQVESYHTINIYHPNAITIEAAAKATGLTNPGEQGITPDFGIGNGSTAYVFGPTIWGYQGYKAPTNTPTVDVTP